MHNKWRKYQSTTTGAKFNSANLLQEQGTTQLYQQETVDAISNLATATANDRATVSTLSATNGTLTSALTACQLQLVEALQDISKLTTVVANLNKNPSAKPSNTENWHYCCTHGYSSEHYSRDCENLDRV